ncbi:hypothetical protein ACSQ67_019942 [Phaseolus vulgaris]
MQGSSSMASTKTNLFPPNSWIATPNLDSWTCREAFYYTQNPDIVLYRAILRNLYQFGEYDNTLFLYKAMVGKSMYPDEESSSFVLRSCFCLSHEQGKMASENGKMEESFKHFCRMRKENIQPNSITVIGLLRSTVELNSSKTGQSGFRLDLFTAIPAISSITRLKYNECGKQMHAHVIRNGSDYRIGALHYVSYLHGYSLKTSLDSLKSLKTSFLSSYAKCGCIEMAVKLFDEEKSIHRDIIAWNSMIGAYSKHGEWFRCFHLYDQMKLSNIVSDQVTFLGLLTTCVNSSLVSKGKEIFKEMVEIYGYQP